MPIKLIPIGQCQADFEKKLKDAGSKLVVVDFYATWCGPCKLMLPIFDQLERQFKGPVVFLKVDVDENDVSSILVRSLCSFCCCNLRLTSDKSIVESMITNH